MDAEKDSVFSLSEALSNPELDKRPPKCKVQIIKEQLSPEEQALLEKAIENIRSDEASGRSRTYTAAWLSKVLNNAGKKVGITTVKRHINKECSCE